MLIYAQKLMQQLRSSPGQMEVAHRVPAPSAGQMRHGGSATGAALTVQPRFISDVALHRGAWRCCVDLLWLLCIDLASGLLYSICVLCGVYDVLMVSVIY
jgi:hypothetical protein